MPSLNDLMYAYFGNYGVSEGANSSSVVATGEVLDPVANTVIAVTANLDPGLWSINCYTNLSGAAAGNDRPNLRFKLGATNVTTIISSAGGNTDTFNIQIKVPSGSPVSVVTGPVNATAGAVYRATIVATRIL
jgi:hypothetical protein